MKAVVAAFNQEKALVGAFSLITNLWIRMELFEALAATHSDADLLNTLNTSHSPQQLHKYYQILPNITKYDPDFNW